MMKTCPFCAEEVKDEAKICKHCGKSFDTKEAKYLFNKRLIEEYQKKKKEEKKGEEEKERKHFESLSEKEKQKYLIKKNRENIVNALLVIIGVASFLLLFHFPYALLFTFLLAILLYSKRSEVFIENMIKNHKKYRIRILLVLASLGLLVAIVISAPFVLEGIKRIQAEKEAEVRGNYPEPKIEIISSLEHQGEAEEYLLEFKVKNTDEAFVLELSSFNSEKVEISGGIYSYTLSLDNMENEFEIIANNQYKESSLEFVITRDETEEEKEIRLAKEEEERERKAEAEAEQLEWDNSKAGKLCEKYPYWSESECTKVADNKYWIGMSLDMLKEQRGIPNSANPSDYGYGTSWQWCWWYYTPNCFYGDDDGIIDSYN